jgi:PKD repeat protein
MKQLKLVFAFCFSIFILSNASASVDTTKVLFIGNSITYFNNMPQLFQSLSASKGRKIIFDSHTPGGSGIVDHYVNNALYQQIRSVKWDVVIIQPGSSESGGVSYPVDTTVKRARILLDSIYKNNPCTKVFLYEIPYGIPSSGGYPTYFQVQTMIRDSVTKMTDSLKLQMLPAGESFRAYYTGAQNMYLHSSINDIHPNANGSYLIAATFYAGIFQDSIMGASYYSSIPKDTALKFFSIVDSVVFKHKANWRINTYNLHADFTYVKNANTVVFANQSVNYDKLLWDFGDGNTSNTTSPSHTFTNSGAYQIKLNIQNKQCFDSAFSEVTIIPSSIKPLSNNDKLKIYPNPIGDRFYVAIDKQINSIVIYDIQGNEVWRQESISTSKIDISVPNLESGVYFVVVWSNNQKWVRKLVKE